MYKQSEFMKALWLDLIHDLTNDDVHYFFSVHFRNTDVLTLIDQAQLVAEFLLGQRDKPVGNKFMLLYDVYFRHDDAVSMRKLLQLLRFPKRYVPEEAPEGNFWETNRKIRDRHWSPTNYLIVRLREIMAKLLAWYRLYDEGDIHLPTGATFTVPREAGSYWRLLEAEWFDPNLLCGGQYLRYQWSLPTSLNNYMKGADILGTDMFQSHSNRMTTVPKNWRSGRNIAIDWAYRNICASNVANAIERCLPRFANLHDQMRNYNLAKLGSKDNSISTIDIHGASDSVSRELCALVLPTHVCYDIEKVVAWNSVSPKWAKSYHRTYFMMSTMGNRVTFPLETLMFSAIVLLAYELCTNQDFEHMDEWIEDEIAVYGDDIICPTNLAPTVCDLLEAFGFEVNWTKSFIGQEYFRESCGGEFYKGVSVSSLYWPRKEIQIDIEHLPLLVALQHKFYFLPRCNSRICKVLRKLFPNFTESYPDSPYDDIWTPYPEIKRAWGSYGNGGKEEEPSCEIHTKLRTSFHSEIHGYSDAERFLYYQFLKSGPEPFGEDVMDQLGYTKQRSRVEFCGTPTVEPVNRKFLI